MLLNSTAAQDTGGGAFGTPTSTQFLVRNGSTNTSGVSYVAYIFAHDSAADGIVQAGTYTGNGSAN